MWKNISGERTERKNTWLLTSTRYAWGIASGSMILESNVHGGCSKRWRLEKLAMAQLLGILIMWIYVKGLHISLKRILLGGGVDAHLPSYEFSFLSAYTIISICSSPLFIQCRCLQNSLHLEFPLWLSRLQTHLASMRTKVWSLDFLIGLRIWHCSELWCSQMRLGSGIAVAVV